MTSAIVDRRSSIVVKRVCYATLAVLALIEIAAPRFLYRGDAHFPFEDWPAFGSIYGFLSCVVIIVVSKLIGKGWLMRSEHYYDR
jgi:hypothetical protein